MVFTENKPSTEPFSFVFLKKLCSFALVIMLIFYTYNQFSQFSDSVAKPNLNFHQQNSKKALTDRESINIITSIMIIQIFNCGFYTFSFQDNTEIKLYPFIAEVDLDGLVKLIINNYAYDLAGCEEKEYVDFNAHTDHISTIKTPNAPALILRPTSMNIYYQEESYYDIGSIISNVGGFFSFISGVFVFLFGATKLAPYGRTKNVTLEERVQSIENILKEYYLDNSLEDRVEDKV
ncbi:hypothetical protein RclHR1_01420009 [Rhizophagus clarus]|uniref:Uncharacterized protein n=1 Tax=Rhizophagus clarus TaxID=94130 RepID=A0A2Z6R4I9_9GLOM|nr:hypothetical protein RclHR1_01420009 [Rhizophagus clarus]